MQQRTPNRQGGTSVAVAATPTTSTLPSTDFASAIAGLQQALAKLSDAIQQLQAQLGTGPAAGAATLAGGPGTPMQHGCGCGCAMGALGGAEQIGKAPPTGGADGAPKAQGANGAPRARETSKGDDAPSGTGARLVAEAKKYLGTPYVWGGSSPKGFDCSGLMQYSAKQLGIDIPRVAKDQAKAGRAVDKGDLQAGDLVYFQGPGKSEVSHIGMYVGGGKFIHAPKTGDVVKISSLSESYYQQTYRGARRLG